MRYFLLLLLPFFFAASCDDDEQLSPVDQLPPATQTGENVVACLIDGEPWVNDPNRTGEVNISAQYNHTTNKMLIRSSKIDDLNSNLRYSIEILLNTLDTRLLNSNEFQVAYIVKEDAQEKVYLDTDDFELEITNLVTQDKIVSGNFLGFLSIPNSQDTLVIKNGHFDITFY